MCHVCILFQLRKRRRQLYHAKKHTFKKTVKSRSKRLKEYKTKDQGVYEKELKPTRNIATIETKLQVVKYWKTLKKQKEEAKKALQEPRPADGSKRAQTVEGCPKDSPKDPEGQLAIYVCKEIP